MLKIEEKKVEVRAQRFGISKFKVPGAFPVTKVSFFFVYICKYFFNNLE